MRSRGRASARRDCSTSGSVSRKLPPTIQNTSTSPRGRVVDHLGRRPAPRRRHRKPPHRRLHRAAVAASTTGTTADLGAALHARMAADRHQAAVRPAGRPRASPTLTSALMVSTPWACCVRPIDQTNTAFGLSTSKPREGLHLARATRRFRCSMCRPVGRSAASRASSNPTVRSRTNASSTPPRLDERPKHADEKREVAARVHVEPVIGQRRAEQRASRDRRHPVPPQPRLTIRIDDGDLRAVAPSRGADTSSSTGWLLATFDPKSTIRSACSQSR